MLVRAITHKASTMLIKLYQTGLKKDLPRVEKPQISHSMFGAVLGVFRRPMFDVFLEALLKGTFPNFRTQTTPNEDPVGAFAVFLGDLLRVQAGIHFSYFFWITC